VTANPCGLPAYPMPREDPLLPPPGYAALRHGPPRVVQFADGRKAWLVTRYRDIAAGLADPSLSSDSTAPGFPAVIPISPDSRALSFFRMDAPEHRRLRNMAAPYFTARALGRFRADVRELVYRLLENMRRGPKPCDLVEAFTDPLPTLVIGRMLGVPDADRAFFRANAKVVTAASGDRAAADDSYRELAGYLRRLIAEKERTPRDDVISKILEREAATGGLSRDDLVSMTLLLLLASHATANQIALSVLLLVDDPSQLTRLRNDPRALRAALNELLRFASIVQYDLIRVATEKINIGGADIGAGDGVIFALPSANHDEGVFAHPSTVDLERRDSARHLAFGSGAHTCVGAPLAYLEMETALLGLFDAFPALSIEMAPGEIPYRHEMLVYGVHELLVSW
jgi:cytochrome P450